MKPYRYMNGRCLDLVQRFYGWSAYDDATAMADTLRATHWIRIVRICTTVDVVLYALPGKSSRRAIAR